MKKFQSSRNGYCKEEVDKYILELEEQLDKKESEINSLNAKLTDYILNEKDMYEKTENISLALTAAVEKAKQIEKSSYNVYKLKIEELEILYARWEKVLNEIIKNYPTLEEVDNVKKLLCDFKSTIKSDIKEDFKFTNINTNIKKNSDPMQVLLSKMNTYLDKQVEDKKEVKVKKHQRRQLSKDVLNKQSELSKLEEKTSIIKPIYNARLTKEDKCDSLLDKFLTEEAVADSVYANKLTAKVTATPDVNETGFNLKEAVNPKDSLEKIMQSFDFFNAENQ